MRKWFKGFLLIVYFLISFSGKVWAYDYEITNFESQIKLEQDSSLLINEKIETNFLTEKHGIFRIIPYIYSYNGETIRARLQVLAIKDDQGKNIPYTIENFNQSKKIKIGDANLTISGEKIYLIEYRIRDVVLDYGNGPEIYWNVTGSEWDVPIEKTRATVESPFGKITKVECFGCRSSFTDKQAVFEEDGWLTIVAQIDKNNSLKMPGILSKTVKKIIDNFGYVMAVLPLFLMFYFWYTLGRDKKSLFEGKASLINRPHLPLIYSPIDGLTPSEVGTVLDEKLDTKDVISEIVELARLGYLKIKKIENKGILGIVSRDYELTKIEKKNNKLKKYQEYLWESLFDGETKTVKISDLKNHFYTHLKDLKEKIYQQMVKEGIFAENPETVKAKWIAIAIAMNVLAMWMIIMLFVQATGNEGPIVVTVLGWIPSLILAWKMPRKTAKGYSLHRQSVGLKYYLAKGKWREEIFEKHLFLEEMLPLAITLGVVDQLAKDMKDLGIEPPKYFQGVAINSFAHDINNFSNSTASGLTSAPTNYSGSGSWSGGSGFSGGGGGGFGGGGGGSW